MPPDREALTRVSARHPRAHTVAELRALADIIERHPEWHLKLAGALDAFVHVEDPDDFREALSELDGFFVRGGSTYATAVSSLGSHTRLEIQTAVKPFLDAHNERMATDAEYRADFAARTSRTVCCFSPGCEAFGFVDLDDRAYATPAGWAAVGDGSRHACPAHVPGLQLLVEARHG